jgi:hypothetical protein
VLATITSAMTRIVVLPDILWVMGQPAKSWELRVAVGLSRLWQCQNKYAAASAPLVEVYGWFTEGFDTADLQEAMVSCCVNIASINPWRVFACPSAIPALWSGGPRTTPWHGGCPDGPQREQEGRGWTDAGGGKGRVIFLYSWTLATSSR